MYCYSRSTVRGYLLLIYHSGDEGMYIHTYIHTNSGCEKRETKKNCSTVTPEKAAPVTRTTLRITGPAPVASRQGTPPVPVRNCVTLIGTGPMAVYGINLASEHC